MPKGLAGAFGRLTPAENVRKEEQPAYTRRKKAVKAAVKKAPKPRPAPVKDGKLTAPYTTSRNRHKNQQQMFGTTGVGIVFTPKYQDMRKSYEKSRKNYDPLNRYMKPPKAL